ncbi:unnamed protein product, partial [Mesorhabditis belari]|uniref:Uncharacterized protein n=1 Tax=Mesorhabditis belari TaxID=2138241 RepID=A0AAF3EZC6_9BILA
MIFFLFLFLNVAHGARQQVYYLLNGGQSGASINGDFEVYRNLAQPRPITAQDYQADGPMAYVKEWTTQFHDLFQGPLSSKNQQAAAPQPTNENPQMAPRVQLAEIPAESTPLEDPRNIHPPVYLGKPQRFNDKNALINDQFNLAQYVQKEAGYELGYHDPRDKNPSAVYSLGPVMEASSLFPFQLPFGKVRGKPAFVSPAFGSYTPFGWMPWKAPEKDIQLKSYRIQNPMGSLGGFGGQFGQSGGFGGQFGQSSGFGGQGFGQGAGLGPLFSPNAFVPENEQEKVSPSRKDSEAVTDYVDDLSSTRNTRDYHLGKAVHYLAQSIH